MIKNIDDAAILQNLSPDKMAYTKYLGIQPVKKFSLI